MAGVRYVWCALLVASALATEAPVLRVQQGSLKGKILTSIASKREYFAFLGIPYAKPPVGDLKFKVISLYNNNYNRNYVVLIDSIHYARACSTYLSF